MQVSYFVIDLDLMVMFYWNFLVEQYFVEQLLMLIVLIEVYRQHLSIYFYILVVQVDQNNQDEQVHGLFFQLLDQYQLRQLVFYLMLLEYDLNKIVHNQDLYQHVMQQQQSLQV
jgi:hypothetical protein